MYSGLLDKFIELTKTSKNSTELLLAICREPNTPPVKLRNRLLQVFRRYVSPDTDHERLSKMNQIKSIIEHYGFGFRPIEVVREKLSSRPYPDDALLALLYEYSTRGKKGYDLTEMFFEWFEVRFAGEYLIEGPRRAGKDLALSGVLKDYTKTAPIDFLITRLNGSLIAAGFARYDSTRGGAQGDDRTGNNHDKMVEIQTEGRRLGLAPKIIFINDGPGLVHRDLWEGSAVLEREGGSSVMVCSLKMLDSRLTKEWLEAIDASL